MRVKMKNFFKFGFAALLAALAFSCSNLETSSATGIGATGMGISNLSISVPVKSILEGGSNQARSATAGGDTTYELRITLKVGGQGVVQSASGTKEELSARVFTFEGLQVGAAVVARCNISKSDGSPVWTGKSGQITISAGTNSVAIKMTEHTAHTLTWDGSQYTCSICETEKAALQPSEVAGYLATCVAGSKTKIVVDASTGTSAINTALTGNPNVLADLVLTGSITSIGDIAFQQCTSLASVTIPSTVTKIGINAFFQCTSLASVTIPAGVTTIEGLAFNGCTSLASVTIPAGVTSIGNSAFNGCSSLVSVTVKAPTSPSLVSTAFSNCGYLLIYVPSGSVSAYRGATGWSSYANSILAIP